ncbi:alkylphosphonate utilization protein [Erysipelotrichaceae bacterium MTC7]|nr:alkylphosphonate utilization protein [Erysipelotrichaceae bacterium MTC7]
MADIPACPKCNEDYTYEDRGLFVCPMCGNEWTQIDTDLLASQNEVKDANGNVLTSGDSISITKDLKVKGSSSTLKVGTKAKNIRLVDATDGHNIECRIDGFGIMKLKSEFVKKI